MILKLMYRINFHILAPITITITKHFNMDLLCMRFVLNCQFKEVCFDKADLVLPINAIIADKKLLGKTIGAQVA